MDYSVKDNRERKLYVCGNVYDLQIYSLLKNCKSQKTIDYWESFIEEIIEELERREVEDDD